MCPEIISDIFLPDTENHFNFKQKFGITFPQIMETLTLPFARAGCVKLT